MNIPFQPAASPVPAPASNKRLIVMDWDDTLSLTKGPNMELFLLADIASKKGDDVIIATMGSKSDTMMELLTFLYPLEMKKKGLPELDIYHKLSEHVYYKPALEQEIKALGHDKAFIIFDNDPETLKKYIRAEFVGEVNPHGKVEDILDLATIMGIRKEFQAALQQAALNIAAQNPRLG